MTQRQFNLTFPIAISRNNLSRSLSEEELKAITELEIKASIANRISTNHYVLEHPSLIHLKNFILNEVKEYMNQIDTPENPLEPYITQSWCNYTNLNEEHHRHRHSNSYLSGVFYIKANREKDSITFFREFTNAVKIYTKTPNPVNTETTRFPVGTGDIIIFPSYLEHMVENKGDNSERISLAFNTFLKGKLGFDDYLTELIL
jgi:uncharacterized protein (TIGR02466 family)